MKLTDENQDDMDCRPLGRETGIATPAWLLDRQAELLRDQTQAGTGPLKPTPADAEKSSFSD